ncbi:non-ribosomal peptide synthetase/MFS transporter [Nonomuraea endophytica]|uniref:Amino acid adenylation domain-containing protein n=1 Tax=Nonomuraea endophytica TaxID=714136 RepID=A0A7W8A3I2_9ACTN|nr:non-ribosomal peptide synthetase [Nonomuraea endophytica]MBB5078839.1 amino acid adenylation domain-containing protein [Nonomuraea endophytica]
MTTDHAVAGRAHVLSSGQERLWFLSQLDPGSASYNMFVTERLHGTVDADALERALIAVVARHEVLRTRYADEDGRPVAVVDPRPRVALARVDLDGPDAEVRAPLLVTEWTGRPFDLVEDQPLRACLIRLGPREHILVVVLHHIAADGWSLGILLGELSRCYNGEPLDPPALQYADYAREQREKDTTPPEALVARLTGAPDLELPADRPRPLVKTTAGGRVVTSLPAGLSERIGLLARRERCTLFMTLMAAFQAQLSRYTGQQDVCVGTPISTRDSEELEPVIGFFLNTVVVRTDLSDDPTFRELMRRVRASAMESFMAADVPFDRLVEALDVRRDLSRTPLFQAELVMGAEAPGGLALDGVTREPYDPGTARAKFDLSLEAEPGAGGLRLFLVYSSDLFDHATAERFCGHFVNLLRQVADDPGLRLSGLELAGPGERALLAEWSRAEPVPPRARTLHEMVETTAAACPSAPAIVQGERALTYAELDGRANRLAAMLRDSGVSRQDRVAICLDQSPELAVAVLGVLKAGAAYVPVDPEQPADRLAYLLADSGAAALVSDRRVGGFDGPVLDVPRAGAGPVGPLAGSDDLAYVIYTSGSTGRPKGVAVQHQQVLNYLSDVRERFGVVEGARFGLLQSLSFDFGITVFYLALMTGGTLELYPSRISGAEFADHGLDYLKMTPSHFGALAVEVPPERLLPRRTLIFGGEGSSWQQTKELAALGRCEIVNHYGPTETTVGVTTYTVRPDDEVRGPVTPIGRPLGHARVYVLDAAMRPVPIGVAGELCVGGDRLAREYLGRPDLTAKAFVTVNGERLYRTGDLARWLPGGDLEFLGRRDLQVKIRGYRVELGEIDEALRKLPGVAYAVADARGTTGSKELVAYLVADGLPVPVGELRRELATALPEYMIPTRYVWLDRLPLKSHGKVDRAALPEPEGERPEQGVAFEPPSGPVEETIAAAMAEVLGLSRVGALDDFFDLGGHSLLATRVIARLRRDLPEECAPVSVMDLFQHPTVRRLAAVAAAPSTPRGLLYRLTPPGPATRTLVCVPYGGGSAVVYQPLASALPPGTALYSVAVPGHDLGLEEEPRPLAQVAAECAAEILEKVDGPLSLYGHCGVGGALTVEIALLLERAGREIETVYLGGIFPFARPTRGLLGLWAKVTGNGRWRSDREQLNWLTSMGADLGDLDEEQRAFIVRNMRHDARQAEEYFTGLLQANVRSPLRAPIVSIVGEQDPTTDYYEERYREWHFLTERTTLVVIKEGGHYFLKYRADELAAILSRDPLTPGDGGTGWSVGGGGVRAPVAGPEPSVRRFLAVALAQMATITGATITEFAIPIWIYLTTGRLAQMALMTVLAVIPGVLAAPLVGAIVDRSSRRAVMLAASVAGLAIQSAAAVLLFTGGLDTWTLYPLLTLLSVALAFQRVAYASAIPQLVPKRYLGHANGVAQMTAGMAQFVAPLMAVGLMSVVGLGGILIADIVGYLVAATVLVLMRFPATLAHQRRETVGAEIKAGFRLSIGNRDFRAMVTFFALLAIVLSPVFMLYSPLVLSFAGLPEVGTVALCGGAGAVAGGLCMSLWGGPRRRRMTGMLLLTLVIAVSCVIVGLTRSLVLIGIGAFGVSLGLALVNGVYATIVQVKVPQRYHGRVFALNQMVAWSTIPLGVGVLTPFAERALEPLMLPGGALAGTVGTVLGTGPGRGVALIYVIFGLLIALLVAGALRTRVLARFDDHVPDATPDDLIGVARMKEAG